jgi:S1-C subfamily serine protease
MEVPMRVALRRSVRAGLCSAAIALVALLGATLSVLAQTSDASPRASEPDAASKALGRASDAVVGVRAIAVEDARSNATLGRMRQGSGVVISDDLVLTIGYLILEADQVQILTDDARELPARVIAYDVATGFGLLQALAPLKLEPVPFGHADALSADEPLMIASGGEGGSISIARIVSRRAFAGYWEYHIEGALFTSPPRPDHSGAGLFNGRGELLGIGSLFVTDALGSSGPRLPGNMFVPIDLLKPILAELRTSGSSSASRRAWLGVNCIEQGGSVRIVRISADSPADIAGLRPGDSIERIDGTEVHALDTLWKALWGGGQPEREVVLDIRRGDKSESVKLQSVDRMKTLRKAQGI